MNENNSIIGKIIEKHLIIVLLVIITLTVFILTYFSIKESRSDSFKLMVMEGEAFIEALTSSAENAMFSENFYDYLVHKRYQEIVIELSQLELSDIDETKLSQLAVNHDLYSIFIYDLDSQLVNGTVLRGTSLRPPDYVYEEIKQLIGDPEENYIMLLDEGEQPDEVVHYYMEIPNRMDRVVLIVADAYYYVSALEQTEISSLAEKMARESDVEYIIYQSNDAIIFSSLGSSDIILDQSDEFLNAAYESDTIMSRLYDFKDAEILEIARPFATVKHPASLLRVGLSLESYHDIVRGFDRQMITLAVVMFGLIVVVVLYINTRSKRKEITKKYHKIKSISDKIFDEMKTGVAAVDKNGRIYLANGAFNQIIKIQSATEKNWNECFSQSELNFSTLMNSIEDNIEMEFSFEHKEDKRHFLLVISMIKNEDNISDGFVSVISDITQLRELELKTARRERLSEMGDLAAGVAHEIRNPLNTISIAAQRLASEFKPTADEDEYISFTKQIKDETKRLNEIITRFLALTRESKNKEQLFNVSDIITDFISLVSPEANQYGIEIKSEIEKNISIKGDPDSMKQVMSNLYNNSREAITGGDGVISLKISKHDGKVVIVFEDSGAGIPEELHQKVFTPYYTTKEAGTGLGLPTVHRIITEMDGDIKIETSLLGGAKFILTINTNKII